MCVAGIAAPGCAREAATDFESSRMLMFAPESVTLLGALWGIYSGGAVWVGGWTEAVLDMGCHRPAPLFAHSVYI